MKKYLVIGLLSFQLNLSAQVIGGVLLSDQRLVTAESKFIFEDKTNAQLVYNISVNMEGEITGAKIDWNKSTQITTPTQVRAMSYVKSIRFEKGTWWPQMHSGIIRITLILPKETTVNQ